VDLPGPTHSPFPEGRTVPDGSLGLAAKGGLVRMTAVICGGSFMGYPFYERGPDTDGRARERAPSCSARSIPGSWPGRWTRPCTEVTGVIGEHTCWGTFASQKLDRKTC